MDENSAPVFIETPISVKVPENAPINFTVLHVKAEDSDRGPNSQLLFSIDSEDFGQDLILIKFILLFSINNSTGIIFVAKELDRERRASYSIEVTVRDYGAPPLSSSTILEIVIIDGEIFCGFLEKLPHFARSEFSLRGNLIVSPVKFVC